MDYNHNPTNPEAGYPLGDVGNEFIAGTYNYSLIDGVNGLPIDPALASSVQDDYGHSTVSFLEDEELAHLRRQFVASPEGFFQLACGSCGARTRNISIYDQTVLNFHYAELREYEDLLLCGVCHEAHFSRLKACQYHSVFQNSVADGSPKPMIRVLSLRSTQNGALRTWQRDDYPTYRCGHSDKKKCKCPQDRDGISHIRWLPPRFPFLWPLWSERALKRYDGFPCTLCPEAHVIQPKDQHDKQSDFVNHIGGFLGRFKCEICAPKTPEDECQWAEHEWTEDSKKRKRLPFFLFAYKELLELHLKRRGHEAIPDGEVEDYIVPNSQDDIFRRAKKVEFRRYTKRQLSGTCKTGHCDPDHCYC
ncbi:hypothetical protein DRE_00948 [Drechslerella stenobrocha 248]|uniref:Uncharacterized protein n=1 Tax=Drechslerella stenobrocha 248 TaxID=1043628 RepID=W7HP11_9PEZI|nr:hypothetical protein DRE_00948 [Drechslerella stenobrocha 248]